MSENFGSPSSGENNILGPDYFGFCKSEVKVLLSLDDSLLPFVNSVDREKGSTKNCVRTQENGSQENGSNEFSNGIGATLSESKKERLKLLLKENVSTLTQEVDEMINPVLSVCRIRSCLKCKEDLLRSGDKSKHPHKKRKTSPACKDLDSKNIQQKKLGNGLPDDVVKKCIECLATSTPRWRRAANGTKSLCNACGLRYIESLQNGSIKNADIEGSKEIVELDDDLRFILENDSTKVEQLMESHVKDISATLHHMEQNLEELLNTLMTSCRAMTPPEKQKLHELILKLPPRYVDRVAEIIGPDKSFDETDVELDQLDNVTLWRLYFYFATIQQLGTKTDEQLDYTPYT